MSVKNGKNDGSQGKRQSFFSPASLAILPFLEMKSNREVTVEGCKGILEYDKEIIRINTGGMVISFKGRGLNIKCLTISSVVIEGFITAVEFVC
ncbi:MAG TPA: sporulation protein [Clostridiales bacterium]|nr:sporulation protein [Clostridiales bacterium]